MSESDDMLTMGVVGDKQVWKENPNPFELGNRVMKLTEKRWFSNCVCTLIWLRLSCDPHTEVLCVHGGCCPVDKYEC